MLLLSGCADVVETPGRTTGTANLATSEAGLAVNTPELAGRPAPLIGPGVPPPAPPPPPPPPGGRLSPGPRITAGMSHLMGRYGITEADAAMRLRNQEHVGALSQSLHADPVAGFSSVWIEHAPRYAVVLAFKRSPDRARVLARAHPTLRPYLEFRGATRDQAEIERDTDRITAAFRGLRGWAGGYDVTTGRFGFDFGTSAGLALARKRVPSDLRKDVDLRVGSIPAPLAN